MTIETVQLKDVYLSTKAGTVDELAELVFQELLLSGYSLGLDDIQNVIQAECRFYSGWAMFEAQKDSVIKIDGNLILDSYEWSILEPVIKANLDLKQAQRMESIKSLGGQEFGLSVSEARQIHKEERDAVPKLAFIEEPYSVELE
ncbi:MULTISPECIES: hypothetical protein [Acinetobacter]|uniref:hypothetical protein n=1 Tax=Acinetobacter TaxID=469 RepID=UPI001F060027|nr:MULTISPECIES: hypothetical protein [Acinetobacter]MCH2003623.1 hypothetical protein [Acinetobacter seifertii]WQF74905.1 hypothetical protein OKW95_19860 [Acinetobacter oleivorans]